MTVASARHVAFTENNRIGKPSSQSVMGEVLRYVPKDLIPSITILLQASGCVTIRPTRLFRSDWRRLDYSVKRMGGHWISDHSFSHWIIPMVRVN